MVRRAVIVIALLAGAAHAQPGLAPAQLQPAAPAAPSVRDRPWSITAGLGGMRLEAKNDEKTKTALTVIDLAAHYRITPAIQVGLSLNAGGAAKGNVSAGGVYIDVRYRFLAERPWNVYALLGLGAMSAAHRESPTEEERRGRGSLRLGVGGERRFERVGIWAELRLGGIADNPDVQLPLVPYPEWNFARYGLSLGSLTVGGTFYF